MLFELELLNAHVLVPTFILLLNAQALLFHTQSLFLQAQLLFLVLAFFELGYLLVNVLPFFECLRLLAETVAGGFRHEALLAVFESAAQAPLPHRDVRTVSLVVEASAGGLGHFILAGRGAAVTFTLLEEAGHGSHIQVLGGVFVGFSLHCLGHDFRWLVVQLDAAEINWLCFNIFGHL